MTQRKESRQFLAGVLAAVAMVVTMAVLRLATDILSLPELLAEGFIRILPAEVFSKLLDLMQHAAKPTLGVLIVVGMLIVGGGLGRIYGRAPSWKRALSIAAIVWFVVGLGFLPLL